MAERNCAKFTGRMCLVPHSEEFECQGPRSRSFDCYCGQGSSLLWTQVQRLSVDPMRLPGREEGNWLVCASVCVMCRVRKVN